MNIEKGRGGDSEPAIFAIGFYEKVSVLCIEAQHRLVHSITEITRPPFI